MLRRPPTGPRFARPEDRLRGRLEARTALMQFQTDALPGGHFVRKVTLDGKVLLELGVPDTPRPAQIRCLQKFERVA